VPAGSASAALWTAVCGDIRLIVSGRQAIERGKARQ
jgi:hypothetical protein